MTADSAAPEPLTESSGFNVSSAKAVLIEAEVYWPDRDTRLSPSLVADFLRRIEAEAAAAAVSAPFYAWTTKTSIRDGSPTGRFVVDWEEADRALAAFVSALREAIGYTDEEHGLEHWHFARGGRTSPDERAGVFVDRGQVLDVIDRVIR